MSFKYDPVRDAIIRKRRTRGRHLIDDMRDAIRADVERARAACDGGRRCGIADGDILTPCHSCPIHWVAEILRYIDEESR